MPRSSPLAQLREDAWAFALLRSARTVLFSCRSPRRVPARLLSPAPSADHFSLPHLTDIPLLRIWDAVLFIWSLRSRVAPLEKYSIRTRKKLLLSCSSCHTGPRRALLNPRSANADTEQHQIGRSDLPWIIRRLDRDGKRADETRLDREPVGTQCL